MIFIILVSTFNDFSFHIIDGSTVQRWCPITRQSTEALDVTKHGFSGMKLSTLAAKDGFLIVGGMFLIL